jgi:hypothetical protein
MQVIPRWPLSDIFYLAVSYIWTFINPVIVLHILLLAFIFIIGRVFFSGSEYVQIFYRLYIYITVNPVIDGSVIIINCLAPSHWCVCPNVICRGLFFMFSELTWQVVVRFYRYWWNCWPSHISTISGGKRQPYCRTFLRRHTFSGLFKHVLIIWVTWRVYYKRQELLLSSVLRCPLRCSHINDIPFVFTSSC